MLTFAFDCPVPLNGKLMSNYDLIKTQSSSSSASASQAKAGNRQAANKAPVASRLLEMNVKNPWIQLDFKEQHYITEIQLRSLKDMELDQFDVRVGNESIAKYYQSLDVPMQKADPFQLNVRCFMHEKGNFFLKPGAKKVSRTRSVRCQVS